MGAGVGLTVAGPEAGFAAAVAEAVGNVFVFVNVGAIGFGMVAVAVSGAAENST